MHACSLAEGQTGRCLARKNIAGEIVSISYGDLTAMQLDPIEKKAAEPVSSRKQDSVRGKFRMQSAL